MAGVKAPQAPAVARGALQVRGAAASIDAAKQGRIRRAAQSYLRSRFRDRWPACRFDVILVDSRGIEWLASAFGEDEEP